jgi:Receptor family ligand binding region/7 transmembrane sweet-taste receptor of 3 GCPR
MAAALLAATHFNNRDPSVVSQLEDPFFRSCKFRFDLNRSRVIDSQLMNGHATGEILSEILEKGRPCAIAGPYTDHSAMGVSTLAGTMEVPVVLYHANDWFLAFDRLDPFLIQTNPLLFELIPPFVDFLNSIGRKYVTLLYSLQSPSTTLLQEALTRILQNRGIHVGAFGFQSSPPGDIEGSHYPDNNVDVALRHAKSSGNFRTVVVLNNFLLADVEILNLASAAEAFAMNGGEYFWSFLGGLPLQYLETPEFRNNRNVTKLLSGAASIDVLEGFMIDKEEDSFLRSWKEAGPATVDILKQSYPLSTDSPGYFSPEENYFQVSDPKPGAGFLYDAVMSIGIGACLAGLDGENKNLSGVSHLRGIESARFTGASGSVSFGKPATTNSNFGVRNSSSVMYGILNLYPPGSNDTCEVAYLLDPSHSSVTVRNNTETNWTLVKDFVYRDGSIAAPWPQRDTPQQNYLSPGVRIFGFALCGIACTLAIASGVWVAVDRNHPVLRAAQPQFLIPICVGALLEATCISLISFDESYVDSVETLDRLCVALPWCLLLGHFTVFSSLFAKVRETAIEREISALAILFFPSWVECPFFREAVESQPCPSICTCYGRHEDAVDSCIHFVHSDSRAVIGVDCIGNRQLGTGCR